jgi:ABC-2 type transport system ATP-binding protein
VNTAASGSAGTALLHSDPPQGPPCGAGDGEVMAGVTATATGQATDRPPATGDDRGGWAIETRGLGKRYGTVLALDGLDLRAPRTAIGLLGANGAGKSTLIKILLGLSRPSAGDALVLGLDARTEGVAIRGRVGYMPEGDCLPGDATAADFVAHAAEVAGLPARGARQRAADVLWQVGLDEERYRLIKGFSTGMKQRVKLAQAIVHDPELVFLDEPTNGMDPQGRDEMLALIGRIHGMMGISVVLSSHILDDIERTCRFVVILDGGRLVASQPLDAHDGDGGDLLVRIDGDASAFAERLAALGLSAEANGHQGPGELVVRDGGEAALDAVRDAAAELGVPLRSLRARTHSLEDLYFGTVGTGRGGGGER